MTFLSRERDRKSYVYTRTRGFYQFRSQSKNVESSVENCNFQFFQNKLKVVANSFSFSTPVVNYRHYLYRSYKQIIFEFRSRIRSWLLSLVLHHTFALISESNKEMSMTQKKNRLSNIEASAKKKKSLQCSNWQRIIQISLTVPQAYIHSNFRINILFDYFVNLDLFFK